MNHAEQRIFRRPPFNPSGRIVARHRLTFEGKVYQAESVLPESVTRTLSERAVRVLWEQFAIDTLPAGAPEKVSAGRGRRRGSV